MEHQFADPIHAGPISWSSK